MASSTFLFCDPVSPERLGWWPEILGASGNRGPARGSSAVFLTGDSLFSLVDAKTRDTWRMLAESRDLRIVADGDELQLHGLRETVSKNAPWVTVAGSPGQPQFWQSLLSALVTGWKGTKSAAFLLCNGPYMSRVSVYMTRFLASVQAAALHPELYTYLDGVHSLHNGQRPSEFENIGRAIAGISASAIQSGRDPWFAACSRCATARGYYQMNPGTGFCEPASCISEVAIRPLKEILQRFSGNLPIVSHVAGDIVPDGWSGETSPRLVVVIANLPYCTEWTFGGLSLALAAAMGGIRTTVLFIEQGVYALYGNHEVPAHDKVFNVQEMIAVTTDIKGLDYLVYGPSLDDRGIDPSPEFPMVSRIENEDLGRLLSNPGKDVEATRILFF